MSARRRPEMSSLLDGAKIDEKGKAVKRKVRKPAALALALGVTGTFIIGVTYLGEMLASLPILHAVKGFLFPLLAMMTIALLLPLIFYISFQEEFGDLNPAIPSHYFFLLRKSFKAIKDNDFKVEAKNL